MKTLRNIAEYLRAIVEQLVALTAAVNSLVNAWEEKPSTPKAKAPETNPEQKSISEIMDSAEVRRRYVNARERHEGWTSTSSMQRRHGIKMREGQLVAIAKERGWELQYFSGRPYIKDENAELIKEELGR